MPKLSNSKIKLSSSKSKERKEIEISYKEFPRSYRLDSEIMNILKVTLYKINEVSPKKVSESKLIKALIWLSQEIDKEKILKALKEVW